MMADFISLLGWETCDGSDLSRLLLVTESVSEMQP